MTDTVADGSNVTAYTRNPHTRAAMLALPKVKQIPRSEERHETALLIDFIIYILNRV